MLRGHVEPVNRLVLGVLSLNFVLAVATPRAGFAAANSAPAIVSPMAWPGVAGQDFNYNIIASNSPTGYDATPLPSGLVIDKATGVISGKPDSATSMSVNISASNASGTTTATLTVNIVPAAPAIISTLSTTGTAGVPFSYSIEAAGATPLRLAASPLPDGISLVGSSLTGTPNAAGTTNVTLTASNAAGSATYTLAITIQPVGFPAITSPLTATTNVGASFSYKVEATGSAPLTFEASGLPAWLALNGDTLTGTPTATGKASVTISAANSGGRDTRTLEITVNAAGAPTITSSSVAGAVVSTAFSYSIAAQGAAQYATSGLPNWLQLNAATLNGTPDSAAAIGNYSIQLVAANDLGCDNRPLVITVGDGTPPSITEVDVSRNPVRINTDVTFSVQASSSANLPLTCNWYFYRNNVLDGEVLPGPNVSRQFALDGEYTYHVVVSDGYNPSVKSGILSAAALAPNPSGQGPNITDGTEHVNPDGQLGAKVSNSFGGVMDYDLLTGAGRAGEGYATDFGNGWGALPGQALASRLDQVRIFVVTTTAKNTADGKVTRKTRRMIPVSVRETGGTVNYTNEPKVRQIQEVKLKGKCTFGKKADLVTLTGKIELAAGLDLSQSQDIHVGLGNIVAVVRVTNRGRFVRSDNEIVRTLQFSFPRPDRTTKRSKAGALARFRMTLVGSRLNEAGLDTEGIVNSTTLKPKTKYPRTIQTALVVGGVSYETLANVLYSFDEARGGSFMTQQKR